MHQTIRSIHARLNQRPLVIVFAVFVLVQVILFLKIGVFTEMEAAKYIGEGDSLYNNGFLTEPKYIFYLPVILLVYLCRLLGSPVGVIVFVQVALSGFSLLCFYRLSKRLTSQSLAVYPALLLALFIPLQSWNFYLYSDSIFISLSIIFFWLIYAYGDQGIKGTLINFAFITVLLFSRPNGVLFIVPFLIYILFRKHTSLPIRILGISLAAFLLSALYSFINAAFTGGGELDIMKPFLEEHIICYVPTRTTAANIDVIQTQNPLANLFYYITHNFAHFVRLTGLKLLSFFNLTRPYYSNAHNLLLIVFMIPVYCFACFGAYRLIKTRIDYSLFLISFLILYPIGISLQCDDWHSRFTMVIVPLLILLACLGVKHLFKTRRNVLNSR